MYVPQIFIAMSVLATGLCLKCYRCYYASDPSLCRHHVTCQDGESCGQQKFDDYLGSHYDLDCIETFKCHTNKQTDQDVFIIGKKRRGLPDISCCKTDLCNVDTTGPVQSTTVMTTSSYPSSTVSEIITTASLDSCFDHPNCDLLMKEFDACNDTDVAMTVCRKSCHMCDVTTTTPLCIDIHQDCQLLSDHLNVCRDEAFARNRCPKTCGVCGTTQTQAVNNTDLISTKPTELTSSVFNQTYISPTELSSTELSSIPVNNTDFPSTQMTVSDVTDIQLVTSSETMIPDTTTIPETTTITTTVPCTDTVSVDVCREVLRKEATSCSDVLIGKMCAFSCQLCSAQTNGSTPDSTTLQTTPTTPTTSTKPLPTTTTTQTKTTPTTTSTTNSPTTTRGTTKPQNEMGVVVVGK